MSALFQSIPALEGKVPWVSLGRFPTPTVSGAALLAEAELRGELWLKRDDLSAPEYGGNKVRLLEHVLAAARAAEATRVYSAGPAGSNHAVATALHAPRVGLKAGAILFHQPATDEAIANLRALAGRADVVEVPHWSLLPWASRRIGHRPEAGERPFVASQVDGASVGLYGYLAAGLELALQVQRGDCPEPARIVLPLGSSATTAGLLLGLTLAHRLGLGLRAVPEVVAVQVVSWPVGSRYRALRLGRHLSERVAALTGDPAFKLDAAQLGARLRVVTTQLGRGFPHPTVDSRAARALFTRAGLPPLENTYSAKAAAGLLALLREPTVGPTLLWCTKSSAVLPASAPSDLNLLPPGLRRWAESPSQVYRNA